ncbi:MAG: Smr/MutS family protein [Bacteroidota bacterium]
MTYPSTIEEKIEFNKIRELVISECLGNLGVEEAKKISFQTDKQLIRTLLEQTNEAKRLLEEGQPFPQTEYLDLTPILKKIRAEGSHFDENELYEFYLSYRTIGRIIEIVEEADEAYANLKELIYPLNFSGHILSQIELILDEHGNIRDNATSTLAIIRSEKRSLEEKLRGRISKILKKAIKDGHSDESALPTIRDGRAVIPVRAENKRLISGFVHDESATGKTVFLEPAEILSANNDLKELWYKEKREIFKILFDVTELIRPNLYDIQNLYGFLGKIDLIFAKARLAIKMAGTLPKIADKEIKASFDWKDAVHPLLFLALANTKKKVVPSSIQLDQKNRILLISGPNAGGKSVTLKTVALLQYMLQCGLLISVKENSQARLFDQIFVDIGDEQSIENDLSTYSSHLKNMDYFLKKAGRKSLLLIDEFGTGTDPQFGAAIAEGILEELVKKHSYGLITTHYSNLKKLAEEREGLVNGAMQYDLKILEPLYALEIGRPGNSFAFEIADKLGLDKSIISKAKKKIGFSQVKYENLLADLEDQLRSLKDQKMKLSQKEEKLNKGISDYNELKNFLEKERQQKLRDASEEAQRIISNSRKEIEKTIRVIKESSADKNKTKEVRNQLEEYGQKLNRKKPSSDRSDRKAKKIKKEKKESLEIGDLVRIKSTGTKGEIITISGKTAEIRVGSLKSRVDLSKVELWSGEKITSLEGEDFPKSSWSKLSLSESKANFSSSLDLRGKPLEEAQILFEKFIDEARYLGENQLKVIHGKGHGVLRNMVKESVKGYSFIKNLNHEHPDRGGDGVSLIEME